MASQEPPPLQEASSTTQVADFFGTAAADATAASSASTSATAQPPAPALGPQSSPSLPSPSAATANLVSAFSAPLILDANPAQVAALEFFKPESTPSTTASTPTTSRRDLPSSSSAIVYSTEVKSNKDQSKTNRSVEEVVANLAARVERTEDRIRQLEGLLTVLQLHSSEVARIIGNFLSAPTSGSFDETFGAPRSPPSPVKVAQSSSSLSSGQAASSSPPESLASFPWEDVSHILDPQGRLLSSQKRLIRIFEGENGVAHVIDAKSGSIMMKTTAIVREEDVNIFFLFDKDDQAVFGVKDRVERLFGSATHKITLIWRTPAGMVEKKCAEMYREGLFGDDALSLAFHIELNGERFRSTRFTNLATAPAHIPREYDWSLQSVSQNKVYKAAVSRTKFGFANGFGINVEADFDCFIPIALALLLFRMDAWSKRLQPAAASDSVQKPQPAQQLKSSGSTVKK